VAAVATDDEVVVDPKEARRLLDAYANDELIALVTPEEMGLAWCRYAARAVKVEGHLDWEADDDGWAAELYHEDEFWANEDFVRAFLVTIATAAPDDVLGWVGAGPLEDFIREEEDRILWVEEQAERSDRFRTALANVWISDLSPPTFLRIERAAGVPLDRPSGPPGTWTVRMGEKVLFTLRVQNTADQPKNDRS
jgi:hypothetical protein